MLMLLVFREVLLENTLDCMSVVKLGYQHYCDRLCSGIDNAALDKLVCRSGHHDLYCVNLRHANKLNCLQNICYYGSNKL